MNKIYLLAGAVLMASTGFSQKRDVNIGQLLKKDAYHVNTTKAVSGQLSEAKAAGDTVWQHDFTNTLDWTTGTNPGHTAGDWNIVTALTPSLVSQVGSYGFPGAMNSASGGNFALIDSDAVPNDAQDAFIETTNNIDLTALGMAPAGIQWTEIYRHFQDFNYIAVSTDGGTTWDEFPVNAQPEVPVNTNSADPEYGQLDISSAMPVTGWNNTVKIRFRYTGVWDWFWAIDDVAVVELDLAVDLAATDVFWAFTNDGAAGPIIPYTQLPSTQLAPIYTYQTVQNAGTIDATSVSSIVSVSGAGTYSGTATNTTGAIAASTSDTLIDGASTFTPAALGMYNILMSAQSNNEVDADLSNNNSMTSFEVTDGIYARDNGDLEGWYGSGDDDGDLLVDPVAFQQDFEINNLDTVYAIQAVFPAATVLDGSMEIYYNIYDGAGTPLYDGASLAVPIKEIFPADLSPTDGSGNIWVSFPFETAGAPGVELDPANGTVFTVEISHDIDSLFLGASGDAYANAGTWTTAGITYNGLTASTSYYITNNYMIRMDMNKPAAVNVDEIVLVSDMQNVPNPFNVNSQVQYTLNQAGTVEFIITDMSGKIVEKRNIGLSSAGAKTLNVDASELASGLYYYSIIVDGNATTKKMSVVK